MRSLLRFAAVVVLCNIIFTPKAAASGVAPLRFEHGGSTSSSVTSQVDAYAGKSGDGWLTEWKNTGNGSMESKAEVRSENPLNDGQNYLYFEVKKFGATGNASQRTLVRQYDTSLVPADHVIEFDFRLESDLSTIDRITFLDSVGSPATNPTPGNGTVGTTWAVRVSGTTWNVFNGQSQVNTNLAVRQNEVYHLTISIVENQYFVSILNRNTNESWSSGALNFFSEQAAVGGYLGFHLAPVHPGSSAPADASVTGAFSISNIVVIPEASSVVLLGLTALGFCIVRRLRENFVV